MKALKVIALFAVFAATSLTFEEARSDHEIYNERRITQNFITSMRKYFPRFSLRNVCYLFKTQYNTASDKLSRNTNAALVSEITAMKDKALSRYFMNGCRRSTYL